MPTKDYEIKTTSSRTLLLSKQDDGNYAVKVYWGRGGKVLATLIITPAEWKKLVNFTAGLEKK